MTGEDKLREYLKRVTVDLAEARRRLAEADEPVAIVGMSCRFPGAPTVDAYWDLLAAGRSAVLDDVPLGRYDLDPFVADHGVYTRSGAFLPDITGWDARFFGFPPREALRMDPQQRLLMELVWEAMEDAGTPPPSLAGSRTAVLMGFSDIFQYGRLQTQRQGEQVMTDPYIGQGSSASVVAGRLAYHFDLRGPTLTLDTACSSSLVAVHLATEALRRGECDLAVVGGAFLAMQPDLYVYGCATSMFSRSGRCRTFDAKADGYVLGEGGGVVVLERQSDALRAGRRVHAVIRGSAVNQDGRSNGLTAPNRGAQVDVIRRALAAAKAAPDQVDYVEAHGSATPLGDGIELGALNDVFGARPDGQPLHVGAVKTNIGHTQAAAGVAGLIKAVLVLEQGTVPANLNMTEPSEGALAGNAVRPAAAALVLAEQDRPHLAGVSSFGWSGTNAHVVLEAAPVPDAGRGASEPTASDRIAVSRSVAGGSGRAELLVASAATDDALRSHLSRLAAGLGSASLADVAYTLQTGRAEHDYRRAVIATDPADAAVRLAEAGQGSGVRRVKGRPRVAFLVPAAGAEYPGLGSELYRAESVYAEAFEQCATLAAERCGVDIRPFLSATPGAGFETVETAELFLFAVQYSLAQLLAHRGVTPDLLVGEGLGEYVAACLAGVFTLEDALWVTAQQARSVRDADVSPESAREHLAELIGSVARQAPTTAMVSSSTGAALTAEQALDPQYWAELSGGVVSRAGDAEFLAAQDVDAWVVLGAGQSLGTQVAAHAADGQGSIVLGAQSVRDTLSAPETADGQGLTSLATQLVREAADGQGSTVVGTQSALETADGASLIVLGTLPTRAAIDGAGSDEASDEVAVLLETCGRLWELGVALDWTALRAGAGRLAQLPAYPFQRLRYWIDPPASVAAPGPVAASTAAVAPAPAAAISAEEHVRLLTQRWVPADPSVEAGPRTDRYVLVADTGGVAEALAERLRRDGAEVAVVAAEAQVHGAPAGLVDRVGNGGEIVVSAAGSQVHGAHAELVDRIGNGAEVVVAAAGLQVRGEHADLVKWFSTGVTTVVDLAALDRAAPGDDPVPAVLSASRTLAAWGAGSGTTRVLVVTSGGQGVADGETVSPAQAAVAVLPVVANQEYLNLDCRSVDLDPAYSAGVAADALVAELTRPSGTVLAACRAGERYVPQYVPIETVASSPASAPVATSASAPVATSASVPAATSASSSAATPTPISTPASAAGSPPAPAANSTSTSSPAATPTPTPTPAVRVGGTYLITGGLGEIGLTIAEHLVHQGAGELILLSRGGVSADPGDPRAAAVQRLRALGAEVRTPQADVTDPAALRVLFTEGRVDGVVHAAADAATDTFRPLRDLNEAAAVRQFGAKVVGARALAEVIDALPAARQPDWCMLLSSTSVLLGGVTFGGYAAANAALGALAQGRSGGTRWIGAVWDTWDCTLGRLSGGIGASLRAHSMSDAQALGAFDRLIAQASSYVVIAAGGLVDRLPRLSNAARQTDSGQSGAAPTGGPASSGQAIAGQKIAGQAAAGHAVAGPDLAAWTESAARHPRPDLPQPYTPPLTATERAVAELWSGVLGIEPVGTHDNFFDLGGTSLLAPQLLALIKDRFGVALPTVTLFEAPTVRTLGLLVDQRAVPAAAKPAATVPAVSAPMAGTPLTAAATPAESTGSNRAAPGAAPAATEPAAANPAAMAPSAVSAQAAAATPAESTGPDRATFGAASAATELAATDSGATAPSSISAQAAAATPTESTDPNQATPGAAPAPTKLTSPEPAAANPPATAPSAFSAQVAAATRAESTDPNRATLGTAPDQALLPATLPSAPPAPTQSDLDKRIAIVGMAGRFPGAGDVGAFWRNLCDGVESISFFTPEELIEAGMDPETVRSPGFVPARPILDDITGFDAAFFGISPRMAAITDPQQRLFLEVCWEALEQAGYVRPEARGRVGVFGGAHISAYLLGIKDQLEAEGVNSFELAMGNEKDALTTTVSYLLDLHGPSVAVQTFCSTSLVAAHLAVRALRGGECEMALAGGVSIRVPDKTGHVFTPGGMESPDGHVRTFDAEARGSMFGDGATVVVLKRLSDALRDGDHIWGVIRGSAVNNDGALKVGYTAPSVVGQARVIVEAMADAGVSAEDIGYVEAHGTGTPLGDPIEVAALTRAFGATRDRQYCPIGSLKPNVGHLDRAAGTAGLIKTTLVLREQVIPPTLHFTRPNPEIDFAGSPFYVNAEPVPWPAPRGRARIAGLNSLGMGGTNVHMVIQEPPARLAAPEPDPAGTRRYQVLPVSARTQTAADESCRRVGEYLQSQPGTRLADAAYTLQVGRKTFEHRRAAVVSGLADAVAALTGAEGALPPSARVESVQERPVAFLLTGVGEQYPGLVGELYRREPVFRAKLDECLALLAEALPEVGIADLLTGPRGGGMDLAALLGRPGAGATDPRVAAFERTEVVQPLMFAVDYALAGTLTAWGLQPALMLGYSLGEYAAACLAGVLSLEDAMALVVHRAKLISTLEPGAMAAVPLEAGQLRERFRIEQRGLDIAAVNGPQVTVVAGPPDAMAALIEELAEAGIPGRALQTTHAFHSRMLAPIADELTEWVRRNVRLNPPNLPYLSNVTGGPADAALVCDPAYWARHMCGTVQFAAGAAALLEDPGLAVVEIGAGQSLGALIRSAGCPAERWPLITATLPAAGDPRGADAVLTECLARLWLVGVELDWAAYHGRRAESEPAYSEASAPGRIPLPTYPFQRQRYWIEPAARRPHAAVGAAGPAEPAVLEDIDQIPRLPEEQWLHLPVWRQTAAPAADPQQPASWLVYTRAAAGDQVLAELRRAAEPTGATITVVRPGDGYQATEDGYTVRPGDSEDALTVLSTLMEHGVQLERVVHLWTLDEAPGDEAVPLGLHTLVALARAAGELGLGDWRLDIVVAGAHEVLGGEVRPESATLVGPTLVIPLEYPSVSTRLIDVAPDTAAAAVVAELRRPRTDQTVAIRCARRWVCGYETIAPAPLDQARGALREQGVYLVTGGLGGIGLGLAGQLARDCRARLVLLGRQGLPPRERWAAIAAGTDPEGAGEAVRSRVARVLELVELGAEVEIVVGDVAEPADVRRAVDRARERFGALHGVLHAAGVPGTGLIQFKLPGDSDRVLAPKVGGARALTEALGWDGPDGVALDFLVLFSSITSATGGGPGQVDYCAANAFLDGYAARLNRPGRHVLSVDWGEWTWNAWDDGLAGYDGGLQEFFRKHRAAFGITFEEGWNTLLRALASGESRVVASTQDLSTMVRLSSGFTVEAVTGPRGQGPTGLRHPRPELLTPYQEPAGPTEEQIAGTWRETLKLDRVGVLDNFFELGGNSLLGISLLADLRRAFAGAQLPPHILYEAPTVASLAKVVDAGAGGGRDAADPAAADRDAAERESAGREQAQLRRSGQKAAAARRRRS